MLFFISIIAPLLGWDADFDLSLGIDGSWGCEYYLPSNDDQVINPSTGMNITVPGDTQRISSIQISEDASSKSVQVQFAGLSHYDITKAAGATPDARDKGLHCVDYSGFNSRGDRVMGVVASGTPRALRGARRGSALARTRALDLGRRGHRTTAVHSRFLLPSMEMQIGPNSGPAIEIEDRDEFGIMIIRKIARGSESESRPTLETQIGNNKKNKFSIFLGNIKSKFQDGSRILVHCGAGVLGQAIISIALGMGCEVFTTVTSVQNKQFLKSLFPKLEDNHIGSCQDISFEHVVMRQTNGEGCDFVINCLKGELRENKKQEAVVRSETQYRTETGSKLRTGRRSDPGVEPELKYKSGTGS
ncbi:Fatty acid synthase [Eumeta japonica]|uniref:Fatty acid synthase n=1 Tax=Eumeta variegata TaxID=151549 RepID=A0A4C1WLT9_EUMVA|nr:Fatty acid synthase [Eumeta japonica]